jgi:hypothetical protein
MARSGQYDKPRFLDRFVQGIGVSQRNNDPILITREDYDW